MNSESTEIMQGNIEVLDFNRQEIQSPSNDYIVEENNNSPR